MKTFGVTLTLLVAGLALAFSVARPASSASTAGTLAGSVGPGFSISLSQNGARVTHLEPGDYTIVVNDQSDIHNFHLFGPGGVDKSTSVDGTGQTTFTVTLVTGTYTYDCDAHPASMIGKFTVGDVPTVTDTTPTQVLKAGSSLKALHRALTATGTASKPAAISVSLWKGTKRLAAKSGTATRKVTLKYTAKAAGKYVSKVVVKAGGKTVRATSSITIK